MIRHLTLALAISFSSMLVAAEKPNILVVLADDLGYSDLGCYGGEIRTPHIDALAAGGVKFTQAYTSARCCPTRASLLTGLYPTQAGIGDFTTNKPSSNRGPGYLGRLRDDCVTMAEALKPAGYGCYYVGKWHCHPETGPIRRGFDEFYGYTRDHSHDQYDADYYIRLPKGRKKEIDPAADEFYATDVFNEYALEFLEQGRESGKPWFLFLGHSSPHFPVQAPAERADAYDATYRRGWDVLRKERYQRMQELGLVDGDRWKLTPRSLVPVDRDDIANGYSGQPNPAWDDLPEDRRLDLARRMAVFGAMVTAVDDGIGRIVAHLAETDQLDNTLILFLSDNGACYEWGPFGFDGKSRKGETTLRTGDELRDIGGRGTHQSYGSGWANLGNTPLRLYKHFTHEGGLSTPLIAHWPKGLAPRKDWIRDPVHVMDVLPTLLDAAGAEYPAKLGGRERTPLEGTSLLSVMRDAELPERTIGFDHQAAHALRKGDWKLVWGKRMPEKLKWELYNISEDRCETNDVAEKHPERVEAMAREWEQWATRVGVTWDAPVRSTGGNETAENPDDPPTPEIAKRPLVISARVTTDASTGVIVAQGGREHGYAIHLLNGKPAFDVRVNGQVTRVAGTKRVPQSFHVEATLAADRMVIGIDGMQVGSGPSPGFIPVQPKDGLNVGRDDLSAAGEYTAPNRLDGKVEDVRVETGEPRKSSRRTPRPPLDAAAIKAGLASHDRALHIKGGWIRDPYITLAPDGWYYLTGTTPNPGDPREQADPYNTGLGEGSIVGYHAQLWRSRDLVEWESLGSPFTLLDGYWAKQQPEKFAGKDRSGWHLWAPEVHFLDGRWHLVHTTPAPVKRGSNLAVTKGDAIEGPYEFPLGDLAKGRHDPSLFRDDDGTTWLLWGNTMLAPLSKDLSSFTADPVRIDPAGSRPGPNGKPISRIGHEGATIRKIGDKYVHFGTAWSTDQGRRGSYNLYYCTADSITGPYGPRRFAGRFLGHGTPFQDDQGRWWCTAFFNGNVPPLDRAGIEKRDLSATAQTINEQGVTIVPLDVRILDDGDVRIRANDPAYASPGTDEVQQFQTAAATRNDRPHIVVYLSDDHSQFDTSLYGNANIHTPGMEALAKDGMTFTHAFVASPSCAPSRAALLTGLMPARNGAEANHTFPKPGTHYLVENLKSAGYEVAAFGKVAHGPRGAKLVRFDVASQASAVPALRQNVARFLRERQSTKPLCLFVGTSNPHVSWDAAKRSFDPAKVEFPPHHLDTPSTREHRAAYYDEITQLDAYLAELRELTAERLGENVLFIHTSDHGSQWPFGKWTLYDYGTRVPFVVSWPGVVEKGTTSDAMISWIDLLPTLIDFAGGGVPAKLDGRSFVEVLRGEAKTHRDRIFTTNTGDGRMNVYPSRSVRTERWKLIWNLHPEFAFTNHSDLHRKPLAGAYWTEWAKLAKENDRARGIVDRYFRRPEFELYDIRDDKWEVRNLAGEPEHAERLATMRAELEAWMRSQNDQRLVHAEPRLLANPEDWHPDHFQPLANPTGPKRNR